MTKKKVKRKKDGKEARRKLRDLLGLGADTIEIVQFFKSVLRPVIAKAAIATAVVGGTVVVGNTIIHQRTDFPKENTSTVEVVTEQTLSESIVKEKKEDTDVAETLNIQNKLRKKTEGLFELFKKYWREGDLPGVTSLLDEKFDDELIQELNEKYNLALLNWLLFEGDKLSLMSAEFERQADIPSVIKVTIPVVGGKQLGDRVKFECRGEDCKITDFWLLTSFKTSKYYYIPHNISYVKDGEKVELDILKFKSTPVKDNKAMLILSGACPSWKGQVFIKDRLYEESYLEGENIWLDETAILAVNQNKIGEIKIGNISDEDSNSGCEFEQRSLTLKLF